MSYGRLLERAKQALQRGNEELSKELYLKAKDVIDYKVNSKKGDFL